MKKISMCLCHFQMKAGDRYALEVAKRIGVDGIDFSLFMHDVRKEGDLYTLGEEAVAEYFTGIRRYADELGLEIPQTHGRLYGFGITPEDDAAFIRNSELDLLATGILRAKYCVVHTPAITWVGDGKSDLEMYGICERMMSALIPFAKANGVKIAAETHGDSGKYKKMEFFGYVEHLIESVDSVRKKYDAKDALCVCVDTGHTNLTVRYGEPSVGDVMRKLGSRLEVLHLHDNNGLRDQHKIPMTGDLDWTDILSALDEIGYAGWYNLENDVTHFGEGFEVEEAAFSVKVLRQMLNSSKNT